MKNTTGRPILDPVTPRANGSPWANNGGKRAGAGRRPGVPNLRTQQHREYARQFSQEAIDLFVTLMRDRKLDLWLRFAAAKEIEDRAYGKAGKHVAVDDDS